MGNAAFQCRTPGPTLWKHTDHLFRFQACKCLCNEHNLQTDAKERSREEMPTTNEFRGSSQYRFFWTSNCCLERAPHSFAYKYGTYFKNKIPHLITTQWLKIKVSPTKAQGKHVFSCWLQVIKELNEYITANATSALIGGRAARQREALLPLWTGTANGNRLWYAWTDTVCTKPGT